MKKHNFFKWFVYFILITLKILKKYNFKKIDIIKIFKWFVYFILITLKILTKHNFKKIDIKYNVGNIKIKY